MTALIGGSVLLVAASAIALVFGWSTADESLIWTSIGASVGAGLLLVIAVVRSRKPEAASARSSTRSQTVSAASTEQASARAASVDRHPVATAAESGRGSDTSTRDEDTIAEQPRATVPEKSTAASVTTRPAVASTPAPAETRPTPARARKKTTTKPAEAAADKDVIAVPDRKRFHRASCRYASAKGAERMSKASARRRGYAACGVCKP